MSLKTFLEKLLPFLYNAAERAFDDLEAEAQKDGINGSKIAQVIKNNLDADETTVTALIAQETGMDAVDVGAALQQIGEHYGITDGSIITYLQGELKKASGTLNWNGLVKTFGDIGAIVLSKGKITWETLALGVGQYIYDKYIKPKS